LHILFAQPTCKVAHARRRPNLITGIAVRALDGVKERSGQFSVRRKNSAAGRGGGKQAGRNAVRAQCCPTCEAPTIFNSGRCAAWASSSSSMRVKTVAMIWGSGKLVMRKALR
jgi:hypothetical protein